MKKLIILLFLLLSTAALDRYDLPTFSFSETEHYLPDIIITDYNVVKARQPEEVVSAYNSVNHEYLVVWEESYSSDFTIFAQRVSAVNGQKIGEKFLVALPTATGGVTMQTEPSVAFDPVNNRYLVVWASALEIIGKTMGRYIDGATGALGEAFEIGNGFAYDKDIDRILILDTKIFYNTNLGEFLVAWTGRAEYDITNYQSEVEIFAAKVHPSGGVGATTRVSAYGEDRSAWTRAVAPSVAYNPITNQYVFVFFGYYQSPIGHTIFAQALSAATMQRVYKDDIELHHADMAHITHISDLNNPEIFYNSKTNEFMLFRKGKTIFAERLSASLESLGLTRINETGTGFLSTPLHDYSVTYRPTHNQYLVTWRGERPLATNEVLKEFAYIYGQLIDADTGAMLGVSNFRITQSAVGHNGFPAVTVDKFGNGYVSYIVTSKPEESGFLKNVGGKIFSPFLQAVTFNYDDQSLVPGNQPPGTGGENGLTAVLSQSKETKESKIFVASCEGTLPDLAIKIYASKNAKLDKKDKILKAKKLKKKKFLKFKVKKQGKMPKFLIAECLNDKQSMHSASMKVK